MTDNCEVPGLRGEIIPSARKGIHDHRQQTNNSVSSMTRYAPEDDEHSDSNISSDDGEGQDETDNVQSKYLQRRRNSYDIPARSLENDDLIPKAKSLPETSLKTSYRDWKYKTHTKEAYYNVRSNTKKTSQKSSSFHKSNESKENQSSLKYVIIGVLVLFIAIIWAFSFNTIQEPSDNYNGQKFYDDLNNLQYKYSINDDSILQIQTGISSIFQKQDTGSFVFAYNSHGNRFNVKKFDDFMDSVSSAAAKFLRNDSLLSQQVNHIVIESNKLGMQTHIELINEYRDFVSETGVMLVKELHKLPSELAMAFHYYCDDYNPLVKKSAIFFTLDMYKCKSPDKPSDPPEPTHAHIEKCLAKRWSDLPYHNIGPLLTRIVGNIVNVTNIR